MAWVAGVGVRPDWGPRSGGVLLKGGLGVALTGRNSERVRAVAAEIVEAGGTAYALPGDVSSTSDVARLICGATSRSAACRDFQRGQCGARNTARAYARAV